MNYIYSTNTNLSNWGIASGIVGILGFLLAVSLVFLEWHRYCLPLQMRLKELILVDSSSDTYLVLLSLTFVNPSSVGKTVYSIRGGVPNREDLKPCRPESLEGLDGAVVRLPNAEKARKVPVAELLWLPLDIPPHQSQSKWYPALIHVKAVGEVIYPQVHLRLSAIDVLGKTLAKFDGEIELKTQVIY